MSKIKEKESSTSGNIKKTAVKVGAKKAFYTSCGELLVKAYRQLLSENNYRPDWEEDTFTINVFQALDTICQNEERSYMPIYQEPQITQEIIDGSLRPLKAKKIDIVFATFYKPRVKYRVEAKILTEEDFGNRNARYLSKEYVVSGVDRFVKKEYEPDGCMVGYVVHGSAKKVLNMINEVFDAIDRSSEKLKLKHTVELYEHCFISRHQDFILKHFLLNFSRA